MVFSNHFPEKKELASDRWKIFSIINSELEENKKMKSLHQYDSDSDSDSNRANKFTYNYNGYSRTTILPRKRTTTQH